MGKTMARIEGWKITGLISLFLVVILTVVFSIHGPSEEGVRAVLRASARSSVILFLLAFSASSMHGLFHTGWTAWVLRNRRYIGVAFAVSHFYHLLGLMALAVYFPHPFLDKLSWITIIGGGIAYGFIAAMAATSFDYMRKRLGLIYWKRLHLVGSYYIWFIFVVSYFPRAVKDAFYIPFVAALVAVLVLRILRASRR